MELVVGLYPSSVRWIGYLAKGLPLLCEVVFVLREEFGTPSVVTNPLLWRFPRWEIVD